MDYIVACHDPELLQALCAFADQLAPLSDPRDPRGVRHALPVLLATLLVALAGGANSLAAVAAFTHDHQAWFRLWLPLGRTTPSRDTYLRLVHRLDPETAVKAALLLLDGTSLPGLRRLILALDGQVARRSGDLAAGTRPLVLEGAIVTIDAAGCQKAIVQALQAAGADYVLALKRNHPTLHAAVRAAFADAERGTGTPAVQDHRETVERNGGRTERRTCTVLGGSDLCARVADPAAWPGLCRLIRVRTERRGHWRVPSGRENGLHRTLDMQFREDDCRLRRGHGPAVMGIFRRAALNMVRTVQQNLSADVSIGLLRDKIGRHPWILAAALP